MALYCFCIYTFTTVLIFGAYSAGDIHIYPDYGIPKFLRYDMEQLMVFSLSDSFNSFLYLAQNNTFSIKRLMIWLLFTKLFFLFNQVVEADDRIPEIATCFALTTLSSFATARCI